MHGTYQVRLVPPDLRNEESLCQILDGIDFLKTVSEGVFSKIDSRFLEFKQRIDAISNRAAAAQCKIDAIRGSNKATKIFASYRYPGKEKHVDYQALFPGSGGDCIQPAVDNTLSSRISGPSERNIREKLQFFNVHPPSTAQEANPEGLGRFPQDCDSVCSLLLFNTGENPYERYDVDLDPLGEKRVPRHRAHERSPPDGADLADAPLSITNRDAAPCNKVESDGGFFYSPTAGDVPLFSAPSTLPLMGVADDLVFDMSLPMTLGATETIDFLPKQPKPVVTGSRPVAQPSVPQTPLNLPDITSPPKDRIVAVSTQQISHPPTSLSLGQPTSVAPPPPPPPPPMLPPPTSTPSAAGAPPPPPPPQGLPTAVAKPVGDRASLLESIRQAGGKAQLRSVKERKVEEKKQKQEEKEKSSGLVSEGGTDLMSEMKRKLMMRREAISGGRSSGASGGVAPPTSAPPPSSAQSPLEAVIHAIPPPPPSAANISGSTDDSDWET